ncbi:MAG: nucleotidyltransferase family protein [Candidatus Acidiferrum sp.]
MTISSTNIAASKSAAFRGSGKKLPPTLILAGGLGTRLRSAYSAGPKSMAPVSGRPFLDYLLGWLKSEGVEDVILCVGYMKSHIRKFIGSGRKWGMKVEYSNERKQLGTGGAVKKAERLISGSRLLVVNGDTFLNVRLSELIEFHISQKTLATLAAVRVKDAGRYGTLRMDRGRRVTAFLEKVKTTQDNWRAAHGVLINGGVYVFEKELLKAICIGKTVSLEKEVFPTLLVKKSLSAFETKGFFLDIGVPEDLRRAQSELPRRISVGHPR